jgi:hypothetical protein
MRNLLGFKEEPHLRSGILEGDRINLTCPVCIFNRRRHILWLGFTGIGATEGGSTGPTRPICTMLTTGFREDLLATIR